MAMPDQMRHVGVADLHAERVELHERPLAAWSSRCVVSNECRISAGSLDEALRARPSADSENVARTIEALRAPRPCRADRRSATRFQLVPFWVALDAPAVAGSLSCPKRWRPWPRRRTIWNGGVRVSHLEVGLTYVRDPVQRSDGTLRLRDAFTCRTGRGAERRPEAAGQV